MSDCNQPGLLPLPAAQSKMLQSVGAVTGTQCVRLDAALDRILAVEITSPLNVPPHDNSAMDGYALASDQARDSGVLRIVGEALAGHPYAGACGAGECVRIMTGAPIPDGLDAVVMQENTQRDGNRVEIQKWPRIGNSIRRRGEDLALGDCVLAPGTRLGPVQLGLLASLGVAEVSVLRRLRIAVLATGDELARPGQELPPGGIYESNSIVISAMLRRLGYEVRDFGIVADDMTALRAVFAQADTWADAVVSSGGVSVGCADFTRDVLTEMGDVGFWKLAIKPGKPFAFGHLPNSVFFGLPGNPVSATVTFHQLAVPVLRAMQGEAAAVALQLPAVADEPLRKRPGRTDFQRARVVRGEDGRLHASSTGAQGSGILSSLHRANAYLVLERERGDVAKGEPVNVQLLDDCL